MNDPLAVGVADGVGNLPQHFQALAGRQLLAVARQIMAESDGFRVEVAKEQRRAKLTSRRTFQMVA